VVGELAEGGSFRGQVLILCCPGKRGGCVGEDLVADSRERMNW
jgi:hypothetical protein